MSVDGEYDWKEWCVAEDFRVGSLAHASLVTLARDHGVLVVEGEDGIDRFAERFGVPYVLRGIRDRRGIDWSAVAESYRGIVISPYVWERRLDPESPWYYTWDCASGCIWDPRAIASVGPVPGYVAPERRPPYDWERD